MAGSAYALAVLFAINLMNFFDRQIIGGVGEGIRREWALSDTALGLLGTVFTLLYAVVGLPLDDALAQLRASGLGATVQGVNANGEPNTVLAQSLTPGTAVVSSSGVDTHNDVERYGWKIVDPAGNEIMEGLDVAERDANGRLRRILMFHGSLPPAAG